MNGLGLFVVSSERHPRWKRQGLFGGTVNRNRRRRSFADGVDVANRGGDSRIPHPDPSHPRSRSRCGSRIRSGEPRRRPPEPSPAARPDSPADAESGSTPRPRLRSTEAPRGRRLDSPGPLRAKSFPSSPGQRISRTASKRNEESHDRRARKSRARLDARSVPARNERSSSLPAKPRRTPCRLS